MALFEDMKVIFVSKSSNRVDYKDLNMDTRTTYALNAINGHKKALFAAEVCNLQLVHQIAISVDGYPFLMCATFVGRV